MAIAGRPPGVEHGEANDAGMGALGVERVEFAHPADIGHAPGVARVAAGRPAKLRCELPEEILLRQEVIAWP